jgi:hypothetical protein
MSIFAIVFGSILGCSEKDTDTSTPISTEETGGETGDETGEETGETAVEANSIAVTNKSVTSASCDVDEFPEDVLTIEVVEGVVQVLHENYQESACLSFEVEGTLDGDVIAMEYPQSGEECDCTDLYRFTYHIEGLDSGTYTFNAPGGVSDTVTID